MKSSRYTVEQTDFTMRQAESGVPAPRICRKMGIAEQTFYRWKKKFAGMGVDEVEDSTFSDSEHFCSTCRAYPLSCRSAILHGNSFWILHFLLSATSHAVCVHWFTSFLWLKSKLSTPAMSITEVSCTLWLVVTFRKDWDSSLFWSIDNVSKAE